MAADNPRRPRRIPFTQEEVENIIAYKKRQKLLIVLKLKKSKIYKILNIFNIVCFFVYFELLLCFFGACKFEGHYALKMLPSYGDSYQNGKPIIYEIEVTGVNGRRYIFVVNDFIQLPDQQKRFLIGKDFLLNKSLKGKFENSERTHRLFSAIPIIFFCMFIMLLSLVAFIYDLNENLFSLLGISFINFLTISGIVFL